MHQIIFFSIVWFPYYYNKARPIFLLRAGESEDCVKHLVVKESDEGRRQLAKETLITTDDKRAYKVKHIVDSMKDLKLKKEWSGLGEADCLLCETKRKDWKDVELIDRGFPITRVADEATVSVREPISDKAKSGSRRS